MLFAVIKTGGKQYKVAEGQKLRIEKIVPDQEGRVVFDKVLMVAEGENVKIGKPLLGGAKVLSKVVKSGRGRKVIILKYRAKKRYKKKAGHRQHFTQVEILKIAA